MTAREKVLEAAEDLVAGEVCPECGARDWLAVGVRGGRVWLRCDDCSRFSLAVPVGKAGGSL